VKFYNSQKGYAYPSEARLAEECHCDIRSVKRCIKRLVKDRWFRIESGGGREKTNQYRPDWEKVTLESPFREPKENTRESEREDVTKVTLGSGNGDSRVLETVTSESPYTIRENIKDTIEGEEAKIASLASLEGKKKVVQQGSGEGFEDGAPIGENVASGTIPPGGPSRPRGPEYVIT